MAARKDSRRRWKMGWALLCLIWISSMPFCAVIGGPMSRHDRTQDNMGEPPARGQPFWGCGLVGALPGIDGNGSARGDVQTLIGSLKATNRKDGRVSYWNWNLAPEQGQYLTEDFVFLPANWGVGPIPPDAQCDGSGCLRAAGEAPFLDGDGAPCPATMGDILLGANEPDIYGSCMGDLMGRCTAPCTSAEVDGGDCPVAHLTSRDPAAANSLGRCDCWTDSHATGVGFWNIADVPSVYQPLPTCWDHQDCIDYVMGNWKKVASKVVERGYKFLSAPMVAVSMDWMRNFVMHACGDGCSDVSCGCPTHVSWHFYANDCQPEAGGGYKEFQRRLDATAELMEDFPHLQGAIVNEVGMLNCAMDTPDAICSPNGPGQKYPAERQPDHACPSTPDLPNGLASFVEKILDMVGKSKTSDGRLAVVSFTWFNMNMEGGTYNLRLFDDGGKLNALGRQYIESCQAWADGTSLGGHPALSPPSGINYDTFEFYATNSILFVSVLLVLTSLLCFCCGVFCGLRYAKRQYVGGDIVTSCWGQKASGQYEMAGVNDSTAPDEDEDDVDMNGVSFGGEFGGFRDHHNKKKIGKVEECGLELELMDVDGEES